MIKIFAIVLFFSNLLLSQLEANLIASDFDQPLYICSLPNTNSLLVLEQDGLIKINRGDTTISEVYETLGTSKIVL